MECKVDEGWKEAAVRHGVVIVGSSVGGVRAAKALRTAGYRGRVTLVGEKPGPPTDRPPLSKQVLTGAWEPQQAQLLSAQAAADDEIELRLGTPAVSLDPEARQLLLADGALLRYDDLVIAAGCEVTLVDPVPVPMERATGPVVGALLAGLQRRNGVATRFGGGVQAVSGRAGDRTVALDDGSSVRAQTVVVGIGAIPNDRWLRACGLMTDDGVVCDATLAAVGTAHIFALGDAVVSLNWPRAFVQGRRLLDQRATAEQARELLSALEG